MTSVPKPTPEEIAHVMAIFRAKDENRLAFADRYGDMRPPMVVEHDGKLLFET